MSDDEDDNDAPVIYDDTPAAFMAMPNKKIRLALVGEDDSEEEDLLCNRNGSRGRASQPARTVRAERPATPPSRGEPAGRNGARRGRAAVAAADLDDSDEGVEPDEADLEDPVYLRRKRELEAARKRLVSSSAVEVPSDEEEVASVAADDAADARPPDAYSPSLPPPPKPAPAAARKVVIKVRTNQRSEPYRVQTKMNKPFSHVLEQFVKLCSADPRRARLMFDGDLVQPSDTPGSLGIEDEDQLDFKAD